MDEEVDVVQELRPEEEMMKLFDELPFRDKVRRVLAGLKMPHDTGEYKWARLQMMRLSAPISAVIVPVLAVLLLTIFAAMRPEITRVYDVKIIEPEPMEELEEPPPPEPIDPPDPVEDVEFTPDPLAPPSEIMGPPTEFSPVPADFNAVAMVKSPVIMRGIYGSRTPGGRGNARARFGGNNATEGAVLRALRWLKKNQAEDGSWSTATAGGSGYGRAAKPAMTALALLSYLAHGETPASEEFGYTVEKAISWLTQSLKGDTFQTHDEHNYCHPIATYAMCEAFGMTKIPAIEEVALTGIKKILDGQHGIWDYNLKQTQRRDTTYSSWCAQAIKAALMARVGGTEWEDRLHKAGEEAIEGFKSNYMKQGDYLGAFGYTGPNKTSNNLTGLGVLCIQLLGKPEDESVIGGLAWIKQNAVFDMDKGWGARPFYYWYYVTQANFHAGGETWFDWNKMFAMPLVNAQIVEKGGGVDGKDIGHWLSPSKTENYGPVYSTTLGALMLQVYYRYLPTFMGDGGGAGGGQEAAAKQNEAGFHSKRDVGVKINM